MEWVKYAMEDLNLGEVENAKQSLTQAIRIARGEGETTYSPYTPPPDGTAATLVDEAVAIRKEKRISQDDFFSELRAIALRCGYKIFKRLKDGRVVDQWYATLADNIGKEVASGYNDLDLRDWLKKQNLKGENDQ